MPKNIRMVKLKSSEIMNIINPISFYTETELNSFDINQIVTDVKNTTIEFAKKTKDNYIKDRKFKKSLNKIASDLADYITSTMNRDVFHKNGYALYPYDYKEAVKKVRKDIINVFLNVNRRMGRPIVDLDDGEE